jgi:hypothetical protein
VAKAIRALFLPLGGLRECGNSGTGKQSPPRKAQGQGGCFFQSSMGGGDEGGPAGLVVGAEAGAGVGVEVFVEQQVVAPVGVGLEFFHAAECRAVRGPAASFGVSNPPPVPSTPFFLHHGHSRNATKRGTDHFFSRGTDHFFSFLGETWYCQTKWFVLL